MTYTKKMHDAIKRDIKDGKNTITTDLLKEIERLQKAVSEANIIIHLYYEERKELCGKDIRAAEWMMEFGNVK
jgi:hypothetical protein